MSTYGFQVHATPEDLGAFLYACNSAGVDLYDCSTTEWWVPAFPDVDPVLTLAGWTQRLANKPAVAGGCVGSNIDNGFVLEPFFHITKQTVIMIIVGEYYC